MFLLMGLCFGFAAFAFLVGAVWTYFSQKRKMDNRVLAVGTVVELTTRITTSGRSSMICPIVEFTASDGEKIRFTSNFGSRPASHQVGRTVNVRYDAVDPQKAEIESAMNLWLTPLIMLLMGIFVCCLAVSFLAVYGIGGSSFSP